MSFDKENQEPGVQGLEKVDVIEVASPSGINEPFSEPLKDSRLRRRVLPNPLVDDFNPDHLKRGVLIPLKTTQEVRQDHTIVQAFITRAPTRCANDVISWV